MKQVELTGFIVGRKNLKDTDKIITVFTKEQGKSSFVAKGIKKPTAKLQSHMEPLVECKFRVLDGPKLPVVVGARAIGQNLFSAKSLEINIGALLLTEVVALVTAEQMPNLKLYQSYRESLIDIATHDKTSLLLNYGLISIMQASGIAPNIQWQEGASSCYLNFSEGSLSNIKIGSSSSVIDINIAKLWKVCMSHPKSTVLRLRVSDLVLSKSLNLIIDYLQYNLERKIKSAKVMSESTNLLHGIA